MGGILGMLLGAGVEGVVGFSNSNAYASDFAPATAVSTYSLQSNGGVFSSGNADTTFWLSPQIGMGAFECRATLVSGALTSGTVGSWLALSADRSWTNSRSTVGSQSATLTIEIRKIGTTTILATATITVAVDVF